MSSQYEAFADLAAPKPACRISIGIPVCDEEDSIDACLKALGDQRDDLGNIVDPRLYEVLVFANNCTDQTIAKALHFRGRIPGIAVHVIDAAKVGIRTKNIAAARRAIIDLCAARMMRRGPDGYLATTDGDTVVAQTWVARTIAELQKTEVVCGRVVPQIQVAAGLRCMQTRVLALEHQYRYSLVRMESALDPLPHDPWPRHGNHQGASFALRAAVYQAVGGIPTDELREDFALYRALLRRNFQVRHSLRVRVATSTRRLSRVHGGFASDLAALDEHVAGRRTVLVDHPRYFASLLRGRHALRHAQTSAAAHIWGLDAAHVLRLFGASSDFGRTCELVEDLALRQGHARPGIRVPIEEAITYIDQYLASRPHVRYDTDTLEIA